MKKFLLSLFICAAQTINAATYYVTTGGSDAADGSVGTPWREITNAVVQASNGDTINVASGDYTKFVRVTKSFLNIVGSGYPGLGYVTFDGHSNIVNGFRVDGPGSAGSGSNSVTTLGNGNIITGCKWTNDWIRGVILQGYGTILSNSYFWHSNTAANAALRVAFTTVGTNCIVVSNKAEQIADPEAFGLVWGVSNYIRGNLMTNCTNPGYTTPGTHGDFLQVWAYSSSAISETNFVEGNTIVDCSVQCFFLNAANTSVTAVDRIKGWRIRNNRFINSDQSGGTYAPFMFIENNLWTNWGYNNGYAFTIKMGDADGEPYSHGTNCVVQNNIFLSNGGSGGTSESYTRETLELTADYNHSSATNYGSKTLPDGTHNTTGDPKFAFQYQYDFRLRTNSPLLNAGTTSQATTDYYGTARPVGSAFEIGIYEGLGYELDGSSSITRSIRTGKQTTSGKVVWQ